MSPEYQFRPTTIAERVQFKEASHPEDFMRALTSPGLSPYGCLETPESGKPKAISTLNIYGLGPVITGKTELVSARYHDPWGNPVSIETTNAQELRKRLPPWALIAYIGDFKTLSEHAGQGIGTQLLAHATGDYQRQTEEPISFFGITDSQALLRIILKLGGYPLNSQTVKRWRVCGDIPPQIEILIDKTAFTNKKLVHEVIWPKSEYSPSASKTIILTWTEKKQLACVTIKESAIQPHIRIPTQAICLINPRFTFDYLRRTRLLTHVSPFFVDVFWKNIFQLPPDPLSASIKTYRPDKEPPLTEPFSPHQINHGKIPDLLLAGPGYVGKLKTEKRPTGEYTSLLAAIDRNSNPRTFEPIAQSPFLIRPKNTNQT